MYNQKCIGLLDATRVLGIRQQKVQVAWCIWL
jgi:hypothetical protein